MMMMMMMMTMKHFYSAHHPLFVRGALQKYVQLKKDDIAHQSC